MGYSIEITQRDLASMNQGVWSGEMKAITFLGTAPYKKVTYEYKNAEGILLVCETNLFPEALYKFFQPDEMLVVVTKDAKNKHFSNLCDRLKGKIDPQPIDIPDGKNADELWSIFDKLTQKVDENDQIVFDFTLAFRYIPFLVFLATAYLRSAKGVKLKAITYGALEAGSGEKAPVFDLAPFIDLLDWTTCTDKFLKTGVANDLSKMLQDAHSRPYQSSQRIREDLPRQLKNTAARMEDITNAISLARAEEVMKMAVKMTEQLEICRQETDRWAKPFSLLLDKTKNAYAPFALSDPRNYVKESLTIQLKLLRWYLEKEQIIQASILAREWLVSLVAYRTDKDPIGDRKCIESMLNECANSGKLSKNIIEIEKAKEIIEIWGRLRNIRNDIAHGGMREQPMPTKRLISNVKEILCSLDGLAP